MDDIITVRPLFFDEFACKASACNNTCCQKWEIDIDDDTKALYEALPGELGYEKLLPSFQLELPTFEAFTDMIQRLTLVEAIDDEWTQRIAYWQSHLEEGYDYFKEQLPIPSSLVVSLFEYIAFRYLDLLEDYSWNALVRFFNESVWYILLEIYATSVIIPSICRWSEEIEYSTENIDILLQDIEKEYV